MRFFGLIGKSLEHSFSPVFFKEKFQAEGIEDCFYNLYPLRNIDEFNQLIGDSSELSGLHVTIPYKQEIIPFLDEIEENAKAIGAVNTIKFEWVRNKLKLIGYNTDYLGFMSSIQALLSEHHQSALVLGTGGSSKAVVYALQKMGIKYLQVSRNPQSKDVISYSTLSDDHIRNHKIIINTTPLGMYPDISQYPDIPYHAISTQHLLFDLIYNPKLTGFLHKGLSQGAKVENGFKMLINQAELSWNIWNDLSRESK